MAVRFVKMLRHFASEFSELRRIKANLLEHMKLNDALRLTLVEIFRLRLFPDALQDACEYSLLPIMPTRLDLVPAANQYVSDFLKIVAACPNLDGLIPEVCMGYRHFVEVPQQGEAPPTLPGLVEPSLSVYKLMPGAVADVWPEYFLPIEYYSDSPTDQYREMIYKCKSQNYFTYVGYYIKFCELLADYIESVERQTAAPRALTASDGVDRAAKTFTWGGHVFGDLAPRMLSFLEVLLRERRKGVDVVSREVLGQAEACMSGGAIGQVFKVNRIGWPAGKLHPAHVLVEKVGSNGFRLFDPDKVPEKVPERS